MGDLTVCTDDDTRDGDGMGVNVDGTINLPLFSTVVPAIIFIYI